MVADLRAEMDKNQMYFEEAAQRAAALEAENEELRRDSQESRSQLQGTLADVQYAASAAKGLEEAKASLREENATLRQQLKGVTQPHACGSCPYVAIVRSCKECHCQSQSGRACVQPTHHLRGRR